MRHDLDYVDVTLLVATLVTMAIWTVTEIRHRGIFEAKNGPMPLKIRHVLMWISLFEIAAITFWRTQHGTFVY